MKYLIATALFALTISLSAQNYNKLTIGDKAPNFSLSSINEEPIKLSHLNKHKQILLIVLRGWPEYQCPVCSRQVGQFIAEAEKFQKLNTEVLFIYPGPSEVLQKKAKEFTADFSFPKNFYFALDPDYKMINKYGLRWDAPRETAYPATYIINKKGKIVYSKVSSSHGGRTTTEEILEELVKL